MSQSDREARMRAMVIELEGLATRARAHVEVMRSAVQESVNWSKPADVNWARGALDDAIVAAGEAERDLRTAREIVRGLFA